MTYTPAPKPRLYAVRPTDRNGKPVSDAVFMVLRDFGWCRLVAFDDDAHYQMEML